MAYFPDIPKIGYEGPKSKNPFAFKHYNPDELIEGKTMREHFRFGAAYWHVMRNALSDPFGGGTAVTPWDDHSDSVDNAKKRADVFFEFLDKIDIDYYCFHDRDIAPELNDLAKSTASRLLTALERARDLTIRFKRAQEFGSDAYSKGDALTEAIDGMAELLTGERTHFHLKAHVR